MCLLEEKLFQNADHCPDLANRVTLPRTGLVLEKGNVIPSSCKIYVRDLRKLAKTVINDIIGEATSDTAGAILNRLEEIARALERPDTEKVFLLRCMKNGKRTVTSAVSKIEGYNKKLNSMFQEIEVKRHDRAFVRELLNETDECFERAKNLKEKINKLYKDLMEYEGH